MKLLVACLLVLASVPFAGNVASQSACPAQPSHSYPIVISNGHERTIAGRVPAFTSAILGDDVETYQHVRVADSNFSDCNGDGIPGDWDGDYDTGDRGAFFGYGAWAQDSDCDYRLHTHGGNVVVNDGTFNGNIWLTVGEDDQSGPVKIQDPSDGSWVCTTSGSITPGDPATDPTADADDCLSGPYFGSGFTCGTGGGDGGYWVFLLFPFAYENGAGVTVANPPTYGTITAY